MKPKIVGILNYTPDSFSDGGIFFTLSTAIERIEEMFEEGADIVDIGAVSTSYNKQLLTQEEEWERVKDLISAVGPIYSKRLSFDTFHPLNAQKAIDLGVSMINDVNGAKDGHRVNVIKNNSHVKYVFMYSLVLPADKNVRAKNIQEIYDFGAVMKSKMVDQGISNKQLIFDPGIGFATDPKLSLEVISNLAIFKSLGLPVYVGHSRKSFLQQFSNIEDRDIETVAASLHMMSQGVSYLRVHNVAMHARAMRVWDSIAKAV